ncbi:MAG TPA: ABC transporter permease [Blastocatellia bacterium]|nr:ABC transporter permease [Blastocatellia bacterium]
MRPKHWFYIIPLRLRSLFHRRQVEEELDEELRYHLERQIEEHIANGMTAEEARSAAMRAIGGVERRKEECRDMRRMRLIEDLVQDLRYGLRTLRKNPGFTAVAVLTLALGIGANTAMFSAVDAVLIRPLPYVDAGRLVMIWDEMSNIGFPKHNSTPAEWYEWRRNNTVFTDIAATQPVQAILSGDGEPEEILARKVTANLWSVLGAQPLLGRVFDEDEDARGERVIVISYGLWQRRFGASPDALGRKITLNDGPYEVIGVMPREFYFMPARDIEIWMPTSFSPQMLTHFSWHDAHCVARLKPGVTLQQARKEMAALSLRVSAPHVSTPRAAVVTPLREELAGKTQTSLIALLIASAVVLLIACVNLANLLMSRWAARRHEMAVRAALGAGRGRLIRQFLVESLALAGFGAIAGLALAKPVMLFLETLTPETMAAVRLTLDWRVLSFSAGVAIAAGMTFGLAPALGWSRIALQEGLRDGGRGSSGPRSHWFQHSLIVIETALAVALLTSGGLLLQTFQHLRLLDLGIRGENLLTFETPLFRYRDFEQRVAFVNAELEKIRAIPGVISAGAISNIPLTQIAQTTRYAFPGQPASETRAQDALSRVVTRDYFATVGARLREGRFFDISDQRSESPAAIVNESFADRNFPGRSPLGARFKFGHLGERGYSYTIVGVVKEIRERGMAEELKPAIYRVHEQGDQTGNTPSGVVVRASVKPESIVSAVRQAVWSIDKNQPITRVQTFEDIVTRQLSAPLQNTALLNAFALLALLLASLGLYGALSYAVTQRANEIGVRMALGATSNDILRSFGKRGLKLTLFGLAVGLILAVIAARFITTLLYGFRPDYLPTFAVVSLILLAVAGLACFVPARRAARVDPLIVLKNDQ